MSNQMQNSSNEDLSLQPSSERDDLYQIDEINFSHTGFAEALMESPYQPSCSTNSSIRTSILHPQHIQPDMSAPKPRQRVYSSGSLSSTISSASIASDNIPLSVPINAAIKDSNHLIDKLLEKTEHEEDLKPEPTQKPQASRKSSFYYPPREGPVRIVIAPGDFQAAAAASRSSKVSSGLPVKGLSRGLPLPLSRKATYGHGHLPPQVFNSSPPKFEGRETTRQRFEEDMNETIMSQEREGDMDSFARHQTDSETQTVVVRNPMNRLSYDLSMAEEDRNNVVSMASPHLHEVHERLKMRKKMPWKSAEKKATVVESQKMSATAKPKRPEEKVNKELSVVLRAPTNEAAKMEAAEPGARSGDPIKKKEPEVAATTIPTAVNSIQAPNTPHRKPKEVNNFNQQHAGRLPKQSPTRHSLIPPSPSRAARELWRGAKKIHKSLPNMDIDKQRRHLRDLREAAGLAPKDLSVLCDWQIDVEYRTILKGLERKWLIKKKSLRESISAWVDKTQRECEVPAIGGGVDDSATSKEEKLDTSVAAVTDTEFETDVEDNTSVVETTSKSKAKETGGGITRTNDGRVHLPVIASYNAPQAPEPPKARVHLPVIASYNTPQPTETEPKQRVRLPVIAKYNMPQSPASQAREDHVIRRTRIPPLSNPAPPKSSAPPVTGYIAAQASNPRVSSFLTPRRNRIVLNPSPIREAREVWNEARKRFRNLPNLSIAQQRLELGAMRTAAGFTDRETMYVSDDKVIEVYRSEMRVLEGRWMGRANGMNEREPFPSSSAGASGNWELLGGRSGEERRTEVEDDEDSDFETMTESLHTPTRKPRPGRG